MILKICNLKGELILETRDFTYSGASMGEKTISTTLYSAHKLNLTPNCYVDFRNERYVIRSEPSIKRSASTGATGDAFQTTATFTSKQYELVDCDFMDYVLGDDIYYTGMDSFSFSGDVYDLCRRIQANLNELKTNKWTILMPVKNSNTPQPVEEIGWSDRILESETLQISVSNENCWNALTRANSDFGFFFYLDTSLKRIYVGVEYPEFKVGDELITLEYGKGKGLYEIQRDVEVNTVITKLRVKGSNRNIDQNYLRTEKFPRFTQNLQLPSFRQTLNQSRPVDYLLAPQSTIDYFGLRPGNKTFDDIYPSITGMKDGKGNPIDEILAIDEIKDGMNDKNELEQSHFYVYLYDLGFDLNKFTTSEEPTMSMKTGYCGGIEFKIKEITAVTSGQPHYTNGCRWKFLLEKDTSSSSNYVIPSGKIKPKAKDKFVLLNILMPENFVLQAEERLREAAQKYLSENSRSRVSYTVNLDEIYFANRPLVASVLKEAVSLRVIDNELGDMTANDGSKYTVKSIQNLVITYKQDQDIPSYQVTLSEKMVSGRLDRIESQVNNAVINSINNINQNQENRRNAILNSRNLRDLKDKVFDTDGYFEPNNIRPNTIETQYLSVGSKSSDFTTNKITMKVYKEDNLFKVALSTGYINHRSLWWGGEETPPVDINKFTWVINNSLLQILPDNNKDYYIYVKADRISQLAAWHVSTMKTQTDEDKNYYHLLLGVIYPEQDNRRDISAVNGMSYISGGSIYGDAIKSINYSAEDDNQGSMYGLDDGTIRIGNITTGGMDYGISKKNTLTVNNATIVNAKIKNKLQVEEEALIAGFKFSDTKITASQNTHIHEGGTSKEVPKLTIDGIGGRINLESPISGGEHSLDWGLGSRISLDSNNGVIESRSHNRSSVSYMSPTGIFSNNAGTDAVSATLGVSHKAAIVGLGFGNMPKDEWSNENFIAGVYGRARNTSTAPAYGGFFEDLLVSGFIMNTRSITDSTPEGLQLFPSTTFLLGLTNSGISKNLILPSDGIIGRTIFAKQIGKGNMRFSPKSGQSIYDDDSENPDYVIGTGKMAMFVFTKFAERPGGSNTWTVKEAWTVSVFSF